MSDIADRRTFAIISHPDAGKTTITEKLLLFGGAISLAGTVKGKKSSKYATSDWMELEKQRGISVTTSVMQFIYKDKVFNLLDTPGHEDFSEDTYRTLTAVDSALMVIDAVKGVEPRTVKLMQICRMRNTPIITFINKLDRDSKQTIELLDEIESILDINCVPITWPIGAGKHFKGICNVKSKQVNLYESSKGHKINKSSTNLTLDDPELNLICGDLADELREELELISGACHEFSLEQYRKGNQTPVFFGSALNNFGVEQLLNAFVEYAPSPLARESKTRLVEPTEDKFSGFVFKIQANMDPQHRDRVAFLRICSGKFTKGMKAKHVRLKKDIQFSSALSFMAGEREHVDTAIPGDIIGLHNHGTIAIGDTFSQGEELQFIGIPYFAPELFRVVRPKDPLKAKSLQKGLVQLSEEGATQVFRPLHDNRVILGAVGILQFDVVAHRLQYEYNVECLYDSTNISTIRWIGGDEHKIQEFKTKFPENLALDAHEKLVYLATSMVNLNLTMSKWPNLEFSETKDLVL